jgi:cadmium resistance protein CadD (predicted permease)
MSFGFLLMIGVRCAIACFLTIQQSMAGPARRYSHAQLPWIMFGLGIHDASGSLQLFFYA